MRSSSSSKPPNEPEVHFFANRAKDWFKRLVDPTSGGERALLPSEVLFLELLQIAKRRRWQGFAIRILVERADQHVQVLRTALEGLPVAGPAEDSVVNEPPSKLSDLERLQGDANEGYNEVLQFEKDQKELIAAGQKFDDAIYGVVQERSRRLLNDFATGISSLPDADRERIRERIDHALEIRHRRFVVLGDSENENETEISLREEMEAVRDEPDEPLHTHALAGVSLSGGGIRSASFAIGALQAMSRGAMIPAYDFISSVSGGGYAASWLLAWAYRHKDGIHGADRELFRSQHADSGPLRWVRRHSSYLAPRPGLTSGDAWALLVAYFSNWLPILFIVMAAMLSILLLPHAVSSLADIVVQTSHHWLKAIAVGMSLLCLIAYMGLVRRLILFRRIPRSVQREPKFLPDLVFWGALFVTLALSLTLPLLSEFVLVHGWHIDREMHVAIKWLPRAEVTVFLFWFVASSLSSVLGWWLTTHTGQRLADGFRTTFLGVSLSPPGDLRWNGAPLPILVASITFSSLVVTLLISGVLFNDSVLAAPRWVLVAFGPAMLLAIFAISEVLGLMFTLNYQRDVDRAWAARVGGWMLSSIVGWSLLCGISLAVTALWSGPEHVRSGVPLLIAALLALLLFVVAATWWIAGRRGALSLAITLGVILPLVFGAMSYLIAPDAFGQIDPFRPLGGLAFATVLTLVLSRLVNVNRYSLHAIYKEGLVRTFLGASRLGPRNPHVCAPGETSAAEAPQFKERRPDPVTNIDDEDNLSLTWLRSQSGRELPILLLNAAVNGMSETDLEGRVPRQWPFTFSQFYSGSPANGIGYAETADLFAGDGGQGVSLGMAMAVSGAAMSPTSGPTTHPLTAFVLGILNARLGIWIGNPREPRAAKSSKPLLTGFTVLREMLGLRAKFGSWIHLSDGGHFENLGIYELLRRGCRRIVVIDASCDPDRKFADLANAIRRARIDLGIQILRHAEWEIFGPNGQANGLASSKSEAGAGRSRKARSWTWFEINYGKGLPKGRLLYVKPSVYDAQTLPVEVRHHWQESRAFPHETTADQFFTERQMEAYRVLGELCMLDAMTVLKGSRNPKTPGSEDADPNLLALVRRSLQRGSA